MHTDAVGRGKMKRLRGQLCISMQYDSRHIVSRKLFLISFSGLYHKLLAGFAHPCSVADYVNNLTLVVRRKNPFWFVDAIHFLCPHETFFLRKAYRRQRTVRAKVFVLGHLRAMYRPSKLSTAANHCLHPAQRFAIDRYVGSPIIPVVAYPPLFNLVPRMLREQRGIRNDLKSVRRPRLTAAGAPSFVLVGNHHSVAISDKIDFSPNAPSVTLENQRLPLSFALGDRFVQTPPRIHTVVSYPNLFNLFQKKQTLAIRERM